MKKTGILVFALCLSVPLAVRAVAGITGEVVEVHSCEVYTGGCIASSEATLDGRLTLRAWRIGTGAFQGVNLAGLAVAVVEEGNDNLAFEDTPARRAVVYVPQQATAAQQTALLAWLKASALSDASDVIAVKPVDITFERHGDDVRIRAGDLVWLQTRALEKCDSGACGEALWYVPRSQVERFSVALNEQSSVAEPSLQITWRNTCRRSVFVGDFGPDSGKTAAVFAQSNRHVH